MKFPLIYVNGKKEDKISVLDHGLIYGDGVFTTFRIFNKKGFCMNFSLERLFESAKKISIKPNYSIKELKKLIKRIYLESKLKNIYIRIILTRGVGKQGINFNCKPNLIIILDNRKFNPLNKIKLNIFKDRRITKLIGDSKFKSLNYSDFVFAKLNANKKGFDDAILLNSKGKIAEASTSNIFIVKKEKLYTPSIKSGILEGCIRKKIIENFKVVEKEISLKELFSADECFLSGTVNFITSVKSVENHSFKKFDYAKKVFDKLIELTNKGEII